MPDRHPFASTCQRNSLINFFHKSYPSPPSHKSHPLPSEISARLDWAYLETDENFDPPEERSVMTSWHAKDPLAEAVFYLWSCGIIDDAYPARVGIFILGDSPDIRPALKAAVASEIPEVDAATL